MIPKQMLEAFGAKYGGRAQKLLAMAEVLAAFQSTAWNEEFDFNDLKDAADHMMSLGGKKAAKALPLFEAAA